MFRDLQYGIRMLRKRPGFTLVVVMALALGIGVNTAIFSVVNAVLLRPLPYKEPGRLVVVWDQVARLGLHRNIVSPANYYDWQRYSQSFESMGAYTEAFFNLTAEDGGSPERIAVVIATPSLLTTLGAYPSVGRAHLPEDGDGAASADRPVIISHSLWQRRFGGNPNIVGQTITLNGGRYSVIGVMPSGFMFSGKKIDAFLRFAPDAAQMANRRGRYLTVLARLKPGVTLKQAQADMDAITVNLAQQYPDTNTDRGANISPLEDEVFGAIRPALFMLLGTVGFVLLIASANVANLLLARSSSRRREFALRVALGATRMRIVRQFLTESILLALVGGVLGLLLARWLTKLIVALSPTDIPRISEAGLDGRVLGFTVAVSLLTGVVFGLLPALHVSRPDVRDSLKEGGHTAEVKGRNRARATLVVVEIALSLILLVGAGLMIRTFISLQRVDPGFLTADAVAMDISLPASYRDPQQRARFFQEIIRRTETLPGVSSAGVTDNLPLSGEDASRAFTIVGETSSSSTEKFAAEHRRVSSHYFDAMGVILVRGRPFTEADTDKAPGVVIINEVLARRFMPNVDPLGKQLVIDDGPARPRQIIGVVRDVKHFSLDAEAKPEMYVPHLDRPWPNMTLVVRAATVNPETLVGPVRSEVAVVDRSIPVANVKTLEQYVAASTGPRRFSMFLLGSFAAVALLLAMIGIYGVMSYSVAQRTQEIGIRMALGAKRATVLKLIIGAGLKLILLGVGIGLVGAFVLTRVISSLLYEVSAHDPIVFLGVTVLLAGAALLACLVPALRATRVDPIIALRYE